MKRISFSIFAIVAMLIISACGASSQAIPTVDPMNLQSTAVSAALTVIAKTQAAIPTTTPIPPTATVINTPVPTNTFIPLPTSGPVFTPNPGGNSYANDPCVNKLLPAFPTGKTIKIRVDNPTKSTINLTVYLQSGNPQGVCGYRGYTLAAQDSLVITDLVEGCYTLWAWNPGPNDYFMVTNGTSCLNSSQSWTFDIVPKSNIKLRE